MISHAHIGHALTGWHDTPEQRGLFETAESEAQSAWRELQYARASVDRPGIAWTHLQNVMYALQPNAVDSGEGLGYGIIPAVDKTIQHIEFAATVDDTSENVRRAAPVFIEHAQATADSLHIALAAARQASAAHPEDLPQHLPTVERALRHAFEGSDIDHDGTVGNLPVESGLVQLRRQLADMVGNEVAPPYKPIGEAYLLGLVRENDGRWVYRFEQGAGWQPYSARRNAD